MVTAWSDACRVGIKAIDEDHKELFDLVAALEEHHLVGSHAEQVDATVHALSLYVAEHFEREERFMRRANFPGYEAHRRIHEDFRGLVQALMALRQRDPAAVDLVKVTTFLNAWIMNHILVKDMEYVPYLTGKASGEDAEAGTKRFQEVTLRVPIDKVDALGRFAALMRDGGDMARTLEQALMVREKEVARKLLRRAESLFGVSE